MIAPGPLLLARGDVVVGDGDSSSRCAMVVATKEVAARANDHVTRRHWDIRIPAEVIRRIRPIRHEVRWLLVEWHPGPGSLSVIDSIVHTLAQGILRDRALGVVGGVADVVREERLVLLVNTRRNVGPPQKRLRILRTVIEANADFEQRRTGP